MFGRRWRGSLVKRCCRYWMDVFGQAELRALRHMEELCDTREVAQYHQTSREIKRHHRFPERLSHSKRKKPPSHQSPRKCKPVSPSHSPTISNPQTPPPAINHLPSSPHSNPLWPRSQNRARNRNAAAFVAITLNALCLSCCPSLGLHDRGDGRGGCGAGTVAVDKLGGRRGAHFD
jgi:hypothetical protein